MLPQIQYGRHAKVHRPSTIPTTNTQTIDPNLTISTPSYQKVPYGAHANQQAETGLSTLNPRALQSTQLLHESQFQNQLYRYPSSGSHFQHIPSQQQAYQSPYDNSRRGSKHGKPYPQPSLTRVHPGVSLHDQVQILNSRPSPPYDYVQKAPRFQSFLGYNSQHHSQGPKLPILPQLRGAGLHPQPLSQELAQQPSSNSPLQSFLVQPIAQIPRSHPSQSLPLGYSTQHPPRASTPQPQRQVQPPTTHLISTPHLLPSSNAPALHSQPPSRGPTPRDASSATHPGPLIPVSLPPLKKVELGPSGQAAAPWLAFCDLLCEGGPYVDEEMVEAQRAELVEEALRLATAYRARARRIALARMGLVDVEELEGAAYGERDRM